MNVLLDTHVVVWWFEDPTQLSWGARDAISQPENRVLISAASVWEISIKRSLGKLDTPHDLEAVVPGSGFEWLPVTAIHSP